MECGLLYASSELFWGDLRFEVAGPRGKGGVSIYTVSSTRSFWFLDTLLHAFLSYSNVCRIETCRFTSPMNIWDTAWSLRI